METPVAPDILIIKVPKKSFSKFEAKFLLVPA
jgi:hypothetical protein